MEISGKKPTILKVNDTFESLEAFECAANLAAKVNGFAFSRKDSNLMGRGGKSPFIILQYTKGGEWRNNWTIAIKRHSTTDATKVEIVWNVTKVALVHNHPLLESDEVATLPQHRTMKLSQKRFIQQLHDCNTPTRVITTAANKIVDGGIIHSKDIVNERARIRFVLNEGPNDDFTQKLLRLFEERNYIVIPSKTAKNSTYKTNIYKYPLVNAIGINNISNEKEQNLKINCHKLFENEKDYELFKKEVKALRFTYDEEKVPESLIAVKKASEKARDPEKAISYIQTWMKNSERWILAYTKRYYYMGISTTG
ncbi:hypothetical protein C2G38_2227936 [Gigaspora rosea]|uniref:Protein FAR1-RELATED SEQUENCE n=1 Tax=Gigaspora rosea TaxID=44941 RepID=A0A397TWE5_9GLOM|nr:hypothetical protein C2G38_2227936 [Gigaspora rosea]